MMIRGLDARFSLKEDVHRVVACNALSTADGQNEICLPSQGTPSVRMIMSNGWMVVYSGVLVAESSFVM